MYLIKAVNTDGDVLWYNGKFGMLAANKRFATEHDKATAIRIADNLNNSVFDAELIKV